MDRSSAFPGFLLLLTLAAGGCVGGIMEGDPNGGAGPGGGQTPVDPFDPNVPLDPTAAGEMPLRRLTRAEYANTVRDLFGESTDAANGLGGERVGSSGFTEAAIVSTVDVDRLLETAEALGGRAVSRMGDLLPCAPAELGEEACARLFVERFGLRAFRRPLSSEEAGDLIALYAEARASLGLGFEGALGLVVQAILQSPQFLYRWELGLEPARVEDGVIALGPYEIASRLSYALWGSMPDDPLFAAAAAGELATAAQIEAQARRMLGDEKARPLVERFHMEWLKLDKVLSLPIDADLKQSMYEEGRRFVDDYVFGEGNGKLGVLFTAAHTFMDDRIAELYGHAPVGDFRRISLDPDERSGILTQPGLLATSYDLIHRGLLVREKLLCQPLPPPPPNIPPLADPDPDVHPRERFVQHSTEEGCRRCHELIDPIGFGFEHYDSLGRYRTMDGAWPIDPAGEILQIDGRTTTFSGAPELGRILFASDQVKQCVAKQLFRFGFARRELSGDAYSIRNAYDHFVGSDFDVRELLVAYVTSRTFRYRAPSRGETVR